MFANRLSISEDTLKKNNLSPRERGRLRYKRLVELDDSGKIAFCTTRKELAQAVGYSPDNTTGVSWVNTMIKRGYLSETLRGFENGEYRKEFHITGKVPDYDNEGSRKSCVRRKNQQLKSDSKNTISEIQDEKDGVYCELMIQKGDLKIVVKLPNKDIVSIINNII